MVERFIADITIDAICDISVTSVRKLITAFEESQALQIVQPKCYPKR